MPKFKSGATALTTTLHEMIKTVSDKPPVLDFAVINSDFSLTLNSFPCPIPVTDYSVCRQLLYDPNKPLTETYTDGEHTHPGIERSGRHSHQVKLPKKMRRLQPGDRVLVAIIQNEFVVIDIIFNATHLITGEPDWK